MSTGKRRPRVLVVDHSRSNQQQICECIAGLGGVETFATNRADEALRLYQELEPSLILLDVLLPDSDGLVLTRQLRALEKLRSAGEASELVAWTPIVFLTAIADEEVFAEGIEAGGDDYLVKPISATILQTKVRAMLRIAEMKRQLAEGHRQLQQLSYLDQLTRIPNRRYFDDNLAREWQRCARNRQPVSAILCDIDFFKQFNDTYGHPLGDRCLTTVAEALAESLFRVEDFVARYGGEEFGAVLPGVDLHGACIVAERMRCAVRDLQLPHQYGIDGLTSCSFGVASLIPVPGGPHHDLVGQADQALYAAKKAGRNRVCPAGRH